MKFEIRNATSDDTPGIAVLCEQLGYVVTEELLRKNIQILLKKPFSKIYTACIENTVVGFVSFEKYETLFLKPGINISGLVVHSDYRKKGIGAELLRVVEKYGKENKLSFVRANSGFERKQAHQFYKDNGYNNEKDQKRFMKYI